MTMRENYSGARTLATVEHLGERFRVVRRRYSGKPWRGYLTLLYGDIPVTDRTPAATDPSVGAAEYKSALEKLWPSDGAGSADSLRGVLADIAASGQAQS